MKLVRTLLAVILLTTFSACTNAPAEVYYCPAWPELTDDERADLRARVPQDSEAYEWLERLFVLKRELATCEELANDVEN